MEPYGVEIFDWRIGNSDVPKCREMADGLKKQFEFLCKWLWVNIGCVGWCPVVSALDCYIWKISQ